MQRGPLSVFKEGLRGKLVPCVQYRGFYVWAFIILEWNTNSMQLIHMGIIAVGVSEMYFLIIDFVIVTLKRHVCGNK